jgi:hypothetical protein
MVTWSNTKAPVALTLLPVIKAELVEPVLTIMSLVKLTVPLFWLGQLNRFPVALGWFRVKPVMAKGLLSFMNWPTMPLAAEPAFQVMDPAATVGSASMVKVKLELIDTDSVSLLSKMMVSPEAAAVMAA